MQLVSLEFARKHEQCVLVCLGYKEYESWLFSGAHADVLLVAGVVLVVDV